MKDDQACAHFYILHSGQDIKLDLKEELFITMMQKACSQFNWSWKKQTAEWALSYTHKESTVTPLVLHGNGPSKWLLNLLLAEKTRLKVAQQCGSLVRGSEMAGVESVAVRGCCGHCQR